MSKHAESIDADRLLQLSEEVSRIAGSLAQMSVGLAELEPPVQGIPVVSMEAVQWIIHARVLRSKFLSTYLFADPAWDMLLELLRAEIAQRRISVSSLCIAANVPAT